jgi:hypothetical protein
MHESPLFEQPQALCLAKFHKTLAAKTLDRRGITKLLHT